MTTHRYKGRSAEGEGRPFFTFKSIQLISAKVWFRSILLLHQVLGGRFLWDLPPFLCRILNHDFAEERLHYYYVVHS